MVWGGGTSKQHLADVVVLFLCGGAASFQLAHAGQVMEASKVPEGLTTAPFSFELPSAGLYESYHGVYINVSYSLTASCERGMRHRSLTRNIEFIVEVCVQTQLAMACNILYKSRISASWWVTAARERSRIDRSPILICPVSGFICIPLGLIFMA